MEVKLQHVSVFPSPGTIIYFLQFDLRQNPASITFSSKFNSRKVVHIYLEAVIFSNMFAAVFARKCYMNEEQSGIIEIHKSNPLSRFEYLLCYIGVANRVLLPSAGR